MKKFILFFFALVASVCAFAQGRADFETLTPSNNYTGGTTNARWVAVNCQIHAGQLPDEADSNPYWSLLGKEKTAVGVCISGNTTEGKQGSITSPVLEGGCGTLSLNYAYMFSDTNGVSFHVAILQDGVAVAGYDVVDNDLAKATAGSWSQKVDVAGDFQIVITNNSPTQSTSHKDRYTIWNLSWTAPAVGQITSLDQLKNDKSYSIRALTNEGYLCYNPEVSETSVSLCGVTDHSYQGSVGKDAWEIPYDAKNPNHAWQIINYDSKRYVYNIGAKKFLGFVDNTYTFVDEPVDINFRTNGEAETVDGHSDLTLGGTFSIRIASGSDTQYVCVCTKNTADPVKWWTYNDHGSPMVIEEAEVLADDVVGALDAAKSKVADVTYQYYVGGKLWKEVVSEQTKGEAVAVPESQAFVTIVNYDGDTVVADGAVVKVQCEEVLPFTTSTEAKPVYGYLRGHSNQIRYAYVNDEGAGMDTGSLQAEMTEFADNYLWYISGNLVDGFELHNKAHGLLRATAGQSSVNGDANSVWQLRAGSAGSKLTENIFALWAEGVTYLNCNNGLKYWNANDAGSTFMFVAVESTDPEPEPTPVTFEIVENEDGTFTVTPSDLEATYFYNVYSPALRNQWYGGAEVNECVKIDVENYISEPETETHKGVSVVQPASWLKAFYGAEYPYGDYQLVVVAIDQVGGGYAVAGDVLVHNYTYEAPEAPEVTFPEEGKAYVIYLPAGKNYLNVVEHELKSARLTNTPEKFFFTKADGGWQIKNEAGLYVGKSTANGWNMNSAVPVNWIVEAVEGGYTLKHNYIDPKDGSNKTGYLAFDKIEINPDNAEQTAAFVDKPADKAAVLDIFEYTFPLTHGVAYKVKNVDAGYYMNISAEANKNVTIEKTPEKIFFDAAENGAFYIKDEDGNYVGRGTSANADDDWTVGNNMDYTWNVVEVDGGYAFQRTDVTTKYLGLDSTAEKAAYWTDKGAANHYAHLIMLFDTPETTPAEDLQAAIDAAKELTPEAYADVPADLFEDLAAAIAKAQPFANEDATVADINEQLAAVEAAINAIKNYVPETAEELLARLQAAVEAGKAIVAANTVEDKCVAGLPGYKALDLVEAVAADVEAYEGATEVTRDEVVAVEHNVKYYNEALPCIPEVGKTYLIRNHTAGVGNGQGFSYVMTAGEEGLELVSYPSIAEVENKHLWTVSEHEFKVEDDWGDLLFSETRYVFTNVATGQIFGYNNGKIGLSESETDMNCWYFVQKTPREIVSGSKSLPYGTLGLQYNDGGNKYTCATVDMRVSDLSISGGSMLQHGLWNTYSSAYIFEVYEPVFWDEEAPAVSVVESTDDVAVKVTFNGAASVEASNYGVLAAIFDENGDAYAIAFNTLFGETVEFNKGTATLHFKKISDIREEYSNAVAESCSRIKAAVGGGDITGKVIILGKSFKVDGNKIYNDDIVADYKVEGGITTGINGALIDANAKIFDLQGRRIAAPAKGLNIMNGNKVVR